MKAGTLSPEHVKLANEINVETIGLQQQEITRLRSLAHLRNLQTSAETELIIAAASWLWVDRDQLVFGDKRMDSLLENGANFAAYLAQAVASDDLLPRYECEGCHNTKCGFDGYLCAEDAQPPAVVRTRKVPLRYARAAARVAEIRERIAGMG
jgi:hypothetical protein